MIKQSSILLHSIRVVLIGFSLAANTAAASASLFWSIESETSSGLGSDSIQIGEQVYLDLTVRRNCCAYLYHFSASLTQYDTSVLSFSHGYVKPEPGMPNIGVLGFGMNGQPHASSIGNNSLFEQVDSIGIGTVQFFSASWYNGVLQLGQNDYGVVTGVQGDPQFRFVFDAVGIGSTPVLVDADAWTSYSGQNRANSSGGSATFSVIPEPSTALLLGLGLTALAVGRGE